MAQNIVLKNTQGADVTYNNVTSIKVKNTAGDDVVYIEGTTSNNDVIIYDPYGDIIQSYSKDAFLALTEYPQAPTLPRLTFEEYNWTLSDAKTYVETYGALDIGAVYTTTSGYCEIDVNIVSDKYIKLTLNYGYSNNATVDWGDGTAETSFSNSGMEHTYAALGKYTILLKGDTVPVVGFNSNSSNPNYTVTDIRCGSNTKSVYYGITELKALQSITFSTALTTTNTISITNNPVLKCVVMPRNMVIISCSQCTNLEIFSACKEPAGSNYFYTFNGLPKLKRLFLTYWPSSTNSNYSFGGDYNLILNKTLFLPSISTIFPCLTELQLPDIVTVPSTVTTLPSMCFQGCKGVKKIIFEENDNLTSFSSQTFYNCKSVEEIVLPNNLTNLNSSCFSDCLSLKKVTLPSTLTSIDSFSGCACLEELTLPSGITSLPSSFLSTCSSIKEIVIPAGVTSIGTYPFQSTYNLVKYDFSNCTSVPTLGTLAYWSFCNKNKIIIVPDSLYDTWVAATNWVSLASFIVKASTVNQ